MKKIIIIGAVILTSGVTALSLSKKDVKLDQTTVKVEKAEVASHISSDRAVVGTAD
jgi:hypothetical protein